MRLASEDACGCLMCHPCRRSPHTVAGYFKFYSRKRKFPLLSSSIPFSLHCWCRMISLPCVLQQKRKYASSTVLLPNTPRAQFLKYLRKTGVICLLFSAVGLLPYRLRKSPQTVRYAFTSGVRMVFPGSAKDATMQGVHAAALQGCNLEQCKLYTLQCCILQSSSFQLHPLPLRTDWIP